MSECVAFSPSIVTSDAQAVAASTVPWTLEVHSAPDAALEAWAQLEDEVPCSIYQTRRWLLPWMTSLGVHAALEPMIVVARDQSGHPIALLPFGVERTIGLRVAKWLGDKDANFALPLLSERGRWTAREVERLLREIGRRCRIDAFVLLNQPVFWRGAANACAALPHRPSPSDAYGTQLEESAESFFASKLSKDARKKLRKKEARLAALGEVRHLVVTTDAEQRRVLDAFLAMRLARFRAQGIRTHFASPAMRSFLDRVSSPAGSGLELHALLAGERIVAVYGGGAHQGRWSGMINAFDASDDVASASPGDLLLHRVLSRCIGAGLHAFDLGIGQARYKAALCDERIALCDVVLPLSMKGRAYAALTRAMLDAKHRLKAHPRVLTALRAVRKAVR